MALTKMVQGNVKYALKGILGLLKRMKRRTYFFAFQRQSHLSYGLHRVRSLFVLACAHKKPCSVTICKVYRYGCVQGFSVNMNR